MKKLIGVIVVLFTLLACIIYRHLANREVKARPEAVYKPRPLHDQFVLFTLLLQ